MRVKVSYSNLKITCNNISKNTNELAAQMETLRKIVEELKTVWQGIDGASFYNNTIPYIAEGQKVPQLYQAIIKEITTLNEQYENIDEKRALNYYPVCYTDKSGAVKETGEYVAVDSTKGGA